MSDFNMVNVQSQSQIGKSVDTTKMHMLTLDLKDFNQFLPVIKELQITSSKMLKDLQPFLAKRDKRTVSLPYNMLRKFQTLKDNLVHSGEVLQFQSRVYACRVGNRDYEKSHDQQFFRRTLKSYDEKRLWMKQYILSNEAMVQRVEEEVKKNIDYQVHQFTQFRRELNVERLEHNFDDKLQLIDNIQSHLINNNRIRNIIKQRLAARLEKKNKVKQVSEETQSKKQVKEVVQSNATAQNTNKLVKIPTFTPFLLFYFSKVAIQNEFLLQQIVKLKKSSKSITHNNQQIKIAMDKIQQKIQFQNAETSITMQQMADGEQSFEIKEMLRCHKVTKTDYFLYLREIQRHSHQILTIYGNYFQYALTNITFPNHLKSKSAAKLYFPKKTTKNATSFEESKRIKQFRNYGEIHRQRILIQKGERQQQRRRLAEKNNLVLKQLSNSSSQKSGEDKVQLVLPIDTILENDAVQQRQQEKQQQQIKPQNEQKVYDAKVQSVINKEKQNCVQLQQQQFLPI